MDKSPQEQSQGPELSETKKSTGASWQMWQAVILSYRCQNHLTLKSLGLGPGGHQKKTIFFQCTLTRSDVCRLVSSKEGVCTTEMFCLTVSQRGGILQEIGFSVVSAISYLNKNLTVQVVDVSAFKDSMDKGSFKASSSLVGGALQSTIALPVHPVRTLLHLPSHPDILTHQWFLICSGESPLLVELLFGLSKAPECFQICWVWGC